MSRGIERAWRDGGPLIWALTPLSWLFRLLAGLRNAGYDLGVYRTHALPRPAVSVGNLTVGGTGKTPVAAWVAQWLLRRGARPAILLRGYGSDEPLVHHRLTPDALIVADPDRVRGAAAAAAQGADVLVLDDAFQHRRARRDLDLVLVSAEQGLAVRRLPAGPGREGPRALGRAQAVVVTRKNATLADAERVLADGLRRAPGAVGAIVSLAPAMMAHAGEEYVREGSPYGVSPDALRPLSDLAGRTVLAISAIGAPGAFTAQLEQLGALVVAASFPDHHAFTAAEVALLAGRAREADLVVCTLKDAVKLERRWPREAPPLWYLSQAVTVERGAEALDALLERLVTARRS